jgi:Domain of unknown function (DUF1905)
MIVTFENEIWLWQGKGAWHFISLPSDLSQEIKLATLGKKGGWGSVKVVAQIGMSRWETSIFPANKRDNYILPLKGEIRKKEAIGVGDKVHVTLEFEGKAPLQQDENLPPEIDFLH